MKRTYVIIGIIGIGILIAGLGYVFIISGQGGNGGNENPPVNLAVNITFTDTDPDHLEIGGTITIIRAVNESDITHYVLYWGSGPSTKSGPAIVELSKTGSDINYPISQNTSILISQTHFLVYTKNEFGEMVTGKNISIIDYAIPTERLVNGGFESGVGVGWVQFNGSYDIIVHSSELNNEIHTGSWSAWHGGVTSYLDGQYQQVTISPNATEASLRFYRLIKTDDIAGTPNDLLNITIRNQSGMVLETLVTYSNLDDVGLSWYFTVFDLSSYIGQTIQVCFESSNDSSGITSFFIDDVSLLADD